MLLPGLGRPARNKSLYRPPTRTSLQTVARLYSVPNDTITDERRIGKHAEESDRDRIKIQSWHMLERLRQTTKTSLGTVEIQTVFEPNKRLKRRHRYASPFGGIMLKSERILLCMIQEQAEIPHTGISDFS
jgi:hypothetical protein